MAGTIEIRNQLVNHLKGGEAFIPVEQMLKKIDFDKLGERPSNLPYSFYELFYHIYISQKDILNYCTQEDYVEVSWPQDYWPEKKGPDSEEEWEKMQKSFFKEREKLSQILLDPQNSLMAPVRSGTKHSLLREILLVVEHNAYHSGQLMIILRLLN